jgi:hypothetical protein
MLYALWSVLLYCNWCSLLVFKNMEVSKDVSKFRGSQGQPIHFWNQNFTFSSLLVSDFWLI